MSHEIIEEFENKQRLCDARGGKTLHVFFADLMAEAKARIAMRPEEIRADALGCQMSDPRGLTVAKGGERLALA